MTSDLRRFDGLLKARMGLDAGSIGEAAIDRAVRLRATACGMDSSDSYWDILQSRLGEVQALIEAVVVPETWFYRYPESLAALLDVVRPRLAHSGVVRILSLPCSSGEEPYSIAMALGDAGIAPERVAIDAVDISEKVIAQARQAVYGANSFRGDAGGFRERHFTPTGQGHALDRRIVEQVRFVAGNLFDPTLLATTAPYDVIFCRNLLIYFDAPTQERALQLLMHAAKPDGMLFVGPAEASLLTRHGLRGLHVPHAFAFRARSAPKVPKAVAAVPAWAASPPADPVPRSTAAAGARRPRAVERRAAPPALPLATPVDDGPMPDIQRLADSGRIEEALAACDSWIASNGTSSQAFYMQGLLHDAAGRLPQAEAGYRKALYLDPSNREALLQLGALLEAQGDAEGAKRLQSRAARGLREPGKERRHG